MIQASVQDQVGPRWESVVSCEETSKGKTNYNMTYGLVIPLHLAL